MPKTKIPSPTRSQGDPVTSRRQKPRTRSVSSPARSNASGSSTVREANKNSFAVSPLGKTMLNDDTDIDQPRCPSWFKRLDHSRVVSEVLDTDTGAVDNVLDELDIDILSHEKRDDTMDLPESSNSSRISSIVIHQRKLFWTKDHLQQKRYREIDKTRESLAKKNKTNITDKTATETGPRNLLNEAPKRTKPIFPGASFKYFPDNTPNKTKILSPEVKARNLFGNRPGTKRKNIYADFILSESEDDISEIQHKVFALKKNLAPVRHSTARPRVSSSNSSVTTDIEMDDWDLLPSSTMVEHQTEATVGTTRRNRTILSKSSEVNESTFANSTANKTKHSNKSASKNHGNDDLNEIAKEKTNVSLKGEPKRQVDVVNEDHEKQNDNIKTLQKISNKSKPVKKYVEEQAVDVQETNDDEEEAEQKQETEVNEQEIEDEQVEEEEMVLQMEDEDENDNNKIEQEVSDNEEQNESQEVQDDNLEEDNIQCNSANNSLNVENDEEDEEIESDNEEEIQNESQNVENDSQDDQEESDDDETESEEKESSDEEQDESRELLNDSQEIENTSQEQSDEENDADIQNDSAEVGDENDEEIQDDSEGLSDGDQEDNEQYDQEGNEKDDQEDNEQDDQEAGEQETEELRETKSETPNVSHDTTGRNRKKNLESPEAVRNEVTNQTISFITKGRNKSITKTENIFKTKHSLAPVTESTRLSDGTKNSSAEGSGWDSHRTTRKTLRQTFGRDFTPRKSLRAMVMEKSAKRQTAINEANAALNLQEAANDIPPEDAQEEKDCDDNVENIEESDHEVSKRTRQTALEIRIEKIKKENRERRLRIEEEVRNSFKFDRHRTDFLTRTPPKPNPHTAKPVKIAPKKRSKFSILSSIYYLPPQLLEDLKYKPPKRYQPKNAAWITKRLYKFLETKLEPVYNYKSRVRAEELVKMMYKFAQDTRRLHGVAPHAAVADLEHEMARLHIVRTHFEFYNFIHDYLPLEVKIKVVPDIINDIPLPSNGLFGDIIESE